MVQIVILSCFFDIFIIPVIGGFKVSTPCRVGVAFQMIESPRKTHIDLVEDEKRRTA
jgi:hypothetical protein